MLTLGQANSGQNDPALHMKLIQVFKRMLRKFRRYPVTIGPIVNIRYPALDLDASDDPLSVMFSSEEMGVATDFFGRSLGGTPSLISAVSHVCLYTLVRNLSPEHVIEIGTYMAGTAETICRALQSNGRGVLHTTDPFGAERVPAVVNQWPSELRQYIKFYSLDSMAFFAKIMQQVDIRPDLVFVDGNHDYEFAAFDVSCAARILRPGGFIVIDNVSQGGPFFAAQDFLALHPEWRDCRVTSGVYDRTKAYDPDRANIPGTDFMVLRGPGSYIVGKRPTTWGELILSRMGFREVLVLLGDVDCTGLLYVQCVLRGFSSRREAIEKVSTTSKTLSEADCGVAMKIALPMDVGTDFDVARVEIWLNWTGSKPLPIREPPSVVS
jgi:predicted O-methyltransferase YrrM